MHNFFLPLDWTEFLRALIWHPGFNSLTCPFCCAKFHHSWCKQLFFTWLQWIQSSTLSIWLLLGVLVFPSFPLELPFTHGQISQLHFTSSQRSFILFLMLADLERISSHLQDQNLICLFYLSVRISSDLQFFHE